VVTEKRPVQVTRYVDEVVCEKVPVKVCKMQQTEEIREVPISVQKPVTERVNYKIPVQTCRWVRQEMVRKVPVTTQRIIYEDRAEQVPVQVCRMVTEVQTVREPRTVATWKPYTTTRCVPRTVVMRVPIDSCCGATTSYYYPAPTVQTMPSVSPPPPATVPSTRTRRVITEPEAEPQPQPTEEPEGEPAAEGSAAGSVLHQKSPPEPELAAPEQADEASGQTPPPAPEDARPTGQPRLKKQDLQTLETLRLQPLTPILDADRIAAERSA
jgi:hypothetical protein